MHPTKIEHTSTIEKQFEWCHRYLGGMSKKYLANIKAEREALNHVAAHAEKMLRECSSNAGKVSFETCEDVTIALKQLQTIRSQNK